MSGVGELLNKLAPTQTLPALPTSKLYPPAPDPLDFTSRYNTPIPPDKLHAFNDWVVKKAAATGRNPLNDKYDYDVNGYFLSGEGSDARGHGSDEFKKPNHPTFSNESIYHGRDGYQGGSWGNGTYTPSQTNINFHGLPALSHYFQTVEPDTKLLPPK